MKVNLLSVQNFRCLKDMEIPLGDTTVIIGENNAGKTAIIDALRIALTRGTSRGSSVFSEYDFYMETEDSDPRSGIEIELRVNFQETEENEWSDEMIQSLGEVAQLEPQSGIQSVHIRATSSYDSTTKSFAYDWQFLNNQGSAIPGKSWANLLLVRQLSPLFYLSALRDPRDEFSTRSKFWAPILKSIEVPDEKREEIEGALEGLNEQLLSGDPKIGRVTTTLGQMNQILDPSGDGKIKIRALPLKPWDLLSKSEIVAKTKANGSWLPLQSHGQGAQSLSILFLFKAFVEHLLKETYEDDSEPILAMEEPETHLHPQAARALWQRIEALPGQKIITSHSPYFVQHVPFKKLRVLRRSPDGTQAFWLCQEFEAIVPSNTSLIDFCSANGEKYEYDSAMGQLKVRGMITKEEYRSLLRCYTTAGDRADVHPTLKQLKQESTLFVSDDELDKMETWAKRMRGEIFFARTWLLCEGQSDYILLHCFADLLGTPLDEYGVALIDYQNCGSPGAFVSLARALGFPWFLICDKDQGGDDHMKAAEERADTGKDFNFRATQLPQGDLEEYLVTSSDFREELDSIAVELGSESSVDSATDEELIAFLRENKTAYAAALANRLRASENEHLAVPDAISEAIQKAVEASNV